MRISTRKKNLFLRVALVALAVYIAASLIGLQLKLNEGEKELAALALEEQALTAKWDRLMALKVDTNELLEQKAREQGMSKPGESVYYIVSSEE